MRHACVMHPDARRLGPSDLVARWTGTGFDQVISGTPAHAAAPSPGIPAAGSPQTCWKSAAKIPLCPSWPGGGIEGAGMGGKMEGRPTATNQVECYATQQGWQPTLQKETGSAQESPLSLLSSRYGYTCISEPRASLTRGRSARLH